MGCQVEKIWTISNLSFLAQKADIRSDYKNSKI